MADALDTLASQVRKTRNFDNPPLERWHPPLSGDIDIRIAADGGWYHEGRIIAREAIVRLFAIDRDHPLFLEPAVGDVAAISLPHGLSALLSRAAWYRLVESAEEREGRLQVTSAGEWFPLQ